MGKISWHPCSSDDLRDYSLAEVSQHFERNDRWIVIDDFVLDVSSWARKHPGGEKIISSYAGQDASEAWYAFHINKPFVGKYMKSLIIGKLKKNVGPDLSSAKEGLLKDFRAIRKSAEDAGLFRPSRTFFAFIMAHILMFEFLGWWTMHQFGISWIPYITACCFLTITQIQAGWAQHDYGHLSVFWNSNLNHITQTFLLNFIKGASSDWWNFRHLNHHAKPNVLTKDPDVTLAPLFLVGKTVPMEYGRKKKKYLPYNLQHKYFHFVLPPLLLPLYFNIEIPYFLVKRKKWMEIFWTSMFFVRWQLMFGSMLGFFGVFFLFLFVRMLESHWFVWATQMSHIPMLVDYDRSHDWVTAQLVASCNIEHSLFNDWWSGHLNFQIEHHLFPTMPRHNLVKVAPQVKALCGKHNLSYQVKPLWKAFSDVVSSLEKSGDIWQQFYNM